MLYKINMYSILKLHTNLTFISPTFPFLLQPRARHNTSHFFFHIATNLDGIVRSLSLTVCQKNISFIFLKMQAILCHFRNLLIKCLTKNEKYDDK